MNWMRHILAVIFTVAYFLFPTIGETQSFSFWMVADTNTLVPDGSGVFASFPAAEDVGAAIHSGNVVFGGIDATTGRRGVYAEIAGTLVVIADAGTLIPPGLPLRFDAFGIPSISGENVVFIGKGGGW